MILNDDSLVKIVEDYISEKRKAGIVVHNEYHIRLKKLRKTDDQIHDLMLEIDNECDKELLAGIGVDKAKMRFVIALIICIAIGVATVILALLGRLSNNALLIMFSGFAAAFFSIFGSINEIKDIGYRKKRREFKWQNWK